MSQNDFSLADSNGATVLADMNSALQALASQSAGATEPSTKYAYQPWYDTTTGLLKFRNSANNAWVTFGPVSDTTKVEFYVNNSKAFDISTALVHTFAGTAAAKLPVGTTAQRPTAVQGMIRYNTSLSLFEGYDGTAWGGFGAPADGSITYVKMATAAIATLAELVAGTASKIMTAAIFQSFRTTPPILRVQCTKASGTNGGQRAASGSWQDSNLAGDILLNTAPVTNNITGASLNTGTGVITLPAGTYKIRGFKTFFNTQASRVRFYNITDAASLVVGSSCYASGSSGTGDSRFDDQFFTIAATKTIKMQTWVSGTSGAAFDLGVAVATGDTEVFGDFTFEKVA